MDGVKGFLREEFLRVRGPLLLLLAVVKDNVKIQKSVELLKIFSKTFSSQINTIFYLSLLRSVIRKQCFHTRNSSNKL